MTSLPPTVIFDLGNVILPFDPLRPCRVLAERIDLEPAAIAQLIYKSNLERKFEQGLIDEDRFSEGVAEALGLQLEKSEWKVLWTDMFDENKAVSGLVRRLKPHHQLILLSNTNRWHWEYARATYPILKLFDQYVLSYEIGVLKPHPAIYRVALEHIKNNRRVIFIDDIPVNAVGASILGIKGLVFESAEKLEVDLRALGCIL